MRATSLRIDGMHCAACVTRLERVLTRVPGVTAAQINFATGQASVDASDDVEPATLIAAVERAGYGARVPQRARMAEQDAEEAAAQSVRWRKAAFALAVAAPSVALMLPGVMPHGAMRTVELALLVFAIPVMVWAGRDFYVGAWKGLPQGQFDMNTLIAAGTGAAFLYSAVAVAAPGILAGGAHAGSYIDVIPVVIGMVLLGQALEGRARRATGAALRALMDLAPAEAIVVREGVEQTVPVSSVVPGELVVVRPGGRVPVDGIVAEGRGAVDQSMLTGEPVPVERGLGDPVTGGTVLQPGGGVLRVQVRAVGDDAVLARIVALVDRAQATRPPVAELVDRVAGIFGPIVFAVALTALVGWSIAGDASRGVVAALAVLVVACPCAMGLATPLSLVIGVGNAARAGVLLRHGRALQALAEADTVVFDKTGTLTVGRPVVREVLPADGWSVDALLRLAAAADRHANHPLANALVAAAPLDLPDVTELRVSSGQGVEALVEGHRVRLGSPRWLGPVAAGEGTPIVVEVDGQRAGVVRVADPPREGAQRAIAALRALGLDVVLLSGDARAEAERVAQALGIARVVAEVLPDGKIAEIARLRAEGRRVIMVGDGVNDAPALAAATVGVAMGTGTDVAMEAAEVTLQRADPEALVDAVRVARATLRNVRQNLAAAFGYNALALPVAAAGALHPAVAGAAMALSSVTVVANARRLARRS